MRNGKFFTTLLYSGKPPFEIEKGSDENNFSMSVHAPFFFFKTRKQDLLSVFKGDQVIAPDSQENIKQLKISRIIPDAIEPS